MSETTDADRAADGDAPTATPGLLPAEATTGDDAPSADDPFAPIAAAPREVVVPDGHALHLSATADAVTECYEATPDGTEHTATTVERGVECHTATFTPASHGRERVKAGETGALIEFSRELIHTDEDGEATHFGPGYEVVVVTGRLGRTNRPEEEHHSVHEDLDAALRAVHEILG